MQAYEIFIILLQVYNDMADSVYQMLGIRYLSVPNSGRADHSATDTLLLMPHQLVCITTSYGGVTDDTFEFFVQKSVASV